MSKSLTAEDTRKAAEAAIAGREAIDNALRNAPIELSQVVGYPVDVALKNRNGNGLREIYLKPAEKPTIGYGVFREI